MIMLSVRVHSKDMVAVAIPRGFVVLRDCSKILRYILIQKIIHCSEKEVV